MDFTLGAMDSILGHSFTDFIKKLEDPFEASFQVSLEPTHECSSNVPVTPKMKAIYSGMCLNDDYLSRIPHGAVKRRSSGRRNPLI